MIQYIIAGAIGYVVAKLFEDNESPKYADGGSVLLAPNGKPSNLAPEQYKLVRTKAFKDWFGDWENDPETSSKVVDSNGEPLVVYHGSNAKFNVFDLEESRFGYFYFAVNKEYAEKFGEVKSYFINARKIKDAISIGLKKITKDKAYKVLGMKKDPTYNYAKDEFWQHLRYSTDINRHLRLNNYDGVKFIEDFKEDKSNIQTEAFAIFNSNQIKLADGTNTTFDSNNPDIRYKTGGEVKDLIVLHNINAHQIEEANKIGGLVTPSIAIVKSGYSFTDFGSITLIGTKELIDPENRSVKVFAGDVYSPSVPRKLYYVDKRLLEKLTNELIKKAYRYDEVISKSNREIYNLVQQHIGDYSDFEKDLNTRGGYELNNYYFDKLKLVYIVDKGIKIKVPMKEKRHFLWNNVEFTLTPEQKKRFAPILKEYRTESNEKGSGGISKEIQSKVYDLFLEVLNNVKLKNEKYKNKENGDVFYKIMNDGLDESFEKYVGTRYDWSGYTEYNISRAVYGEQILDTEKLNQNIKKIFTKQVVEDYKKWLSDFINQFRGSAYFLKGNEKVPYTLDNLVDATSNRVIGQEKNITFGVNQAKSFGTKRLNSINEIKKNSNKLISKEEMSFIDDKNKEVFFKLSESLKYEYSDTWGKLDSLGRALADYFKGNSIVSALRKNDFKNPSSYQIDLFKDFADELKNSPVDYFEAKYQRAVSLREFKYAVVPKETSKEVIQVLSENGLIIKKYQSTDERIEIVNNISNKDKSIKFDNGGEITTYTEFYNNLKIEDGSKYIGQKFTDVFPFIAKRKTPNDYRIILKQYHGILKRIEQDNYSTKAMKQTDLNKLERMKPNLDKQKYLARFYLDSKGVIMKFIK
jgi:hypothetical protein